MRISDWSSDVCSSDLRDAYDQRDVDIAPDHGHSFRAISTTRGLPNLSCFRRPHRDCSVVIAPFRTQYLAGVARPNDTEIAKPDPCLNLVEGMMKSDRVAPPPDPSRDRRAKMSIAVATHAGGHVRSVESRVGKKCVSRW